MFVVVAVGFGEVKGGGWVGGKNLIGGTQARTHIFTHAKKNIYIYIFTLFTSQLFVFKEVHAVYSIAYNCNMHYIIFFVIIHYYIA